MGGSGWVSLGLGGSGTGTEEKLHVLWSPEKTDLAPMGCNQISVRSRIFILVSSHSHLRSLTSMTKEARNSKISERENYLAVIEPLSVANPEL